MKTTYVKTLICGLFLAIQSISFAQSLEVTGKFLNSTEKTISAYYILVCNDTVIDIGMKNKVKLNLDLNKQYTLIVSKKGFKNKTIRFSTYASTNEKFSFNFEAILKGEQVQKKSAKTVVSNQVIIYFDYAIEEFNYMCINKD